MVYTFHYDPTFGITFENNGVSDHILCTATNWLSESLLRPPETRICRGLLFTGVLFTECIVRFAIFLGSGHWGWFLLIAHGRDLATGLDIHWLLHLRAGAVSAADDLT